MSQRGNRLMHQSEQQEERSLWQKVVNELKALMAHEAKVNDTRRKIDTLEERSRRPEGERPPHIPWIAQNIICDSCEEIGDLKAIILQNI